MSDLERMRADFESHQDVMPAVILGLIPRTDLNAFFALGRIAAAAGWGYEYEVTDMDGVLMARLSNPAEVKWARDHGKVRHYL
jgi:hypothetical protein